MIFVFDLDDTVCETDEYSEQYILEFFKNNNLKYKKISNCARYAEKKFDWSLEDSISWYKQYGDDMMLNFPCKANAIETINKLYDLGHTIIISTARSTDWHSDPHGTTLKWLEANSIKYHKLYTGRSDKEKICALENADFFIDDDVSITTRVAESFSSTPSKKVFLMSTIYNKNLTIPQSVKRITDFLELREYLKKYNIDF